MSRRPGGDDSFAWWAAPLTGQELAQVQDWFDDRTEDEDQVAFRDAAKERVIRLQRFDGDELDKVMRRHHEESWELP